MQTLITDALVLRNAEYGDYDRMVTLLTPDHGQLDAIARGCRRPKSALLNAASPFVSGEYRLYRHRDRMSIDACRITEGFFPLRDDYDRLVHGAYWLRLLCAVTEPEVPCRELFLMTLAALAHLAYADLPPELVTAAFEMHLMTHLGFAPSMDRCVLCGRPIEGDARFDPERGGAVCSEHGWGEIRLSNGARRIMMKTPRTRFEQIVLLKDRPEWPEAARAFRSYVQSHLQGDFRAPDAPPSCNIDRREVSE